MDGNLPRSISSADLNCTRRCREMLKKDCKAGPLTATTYFNATPTFTLIIPPLDEYPQEFKRFVFERLINYHTKQYLEEIHCLNWCQGATTLVPLYTTGDGNCLMHAASLGMWGFQDRDFTLRSAVYEALCDSRGNTLYARWKLAHEERMGQANYRLDRNDLARDWDILIQNVSLEKTRHGSLESLEEFHIFVLANVLRRPIIVYAETKFRSEVGGTTLQNLEFNGLYLPLLWSSENTKRSPLPIAFTNGHFQALSVIDLPKEYHGDSATQYLVVPLIDAYGQQLPVRFTFPEERPQDLIHDYLDTLNFFPKYGGGRPTYSAKLVVEKTPGYLLPLLQGYIGKCYDSFSRKPASNPPPGASGGDMGGTKCLAGCGFNGDARYEGFCSQCYKKFEGKGGSPAQQHLDHQPGDSGMSSLRCSNNCSNPGFPEYLGMCKACFDKKQGSGPPLSPVQQPPTPSSQDDGGVRKCMTPGCDFFGSEETKFYCSKCVNERFEEIAKGGGGGHQVMKQSQQQMVSGIERPYERPYERPNERPYERPYERPNERPYERPNERPYERPNDRGYSEGRPNERPKFNDKGERLCTQCEVYHADDELGGLCNACFLDMTKEEAKQASPSQQPRDLPRRSSAHDVLPPTRSSHNVFASQEPVMPRSQTDIIKPTPAPRKPRKSPNMEQSRIKETPCCLCDLKVELADISFICRGHAKFARDKYIAATKVNGVSGSGSDEVDYTASDPRYGDRCQTSNLSSVVHSKNTPQSHNERPRYHTDISDRRLHEELHEPPSDPPAMSYHNPTTNNFSSDRYAGGHGRFDDNRSRHHDGGGSADRQYNSDHRQLPLNDARDRGQLPQDAYHHQDRFRGDDRTKPYSGRESNQSPGDQHGRRQPPLNDDYYAQDRGRYQDQDDRSRQRPPPHQDGRPYDQRPPPPQDGRSYNDRSPYEDRRDGRQPHYEAEYERDQHRGHTGERMQDRVRQGGGATGVGGASGGVGGASGGGQYVDVVSQKFVPQDKQKILCKVVGCSFYSIDEYDGFCKNCHKEYIVKKKPLPQLNN